MIVKQMDIRANIKKYFDLAYSGDTIIVPRKGNKNIVIISEEEYTRLTGLERISAYTDAFASHTHSEKPVVADSGDIRTDNLARLDVISNLKDGWNGNEAPAIPKIVISRVRDLIKEMYIQPEVFPTTLRSIQLEFDNSRRDHMVIEIGESHEAEVFIVLYNGEEHFETINVNSEDINRKVRAFYG